MTAKTRIEPRGRVRVILTPAAVLLIVVITGLKVELSEPRITPDSLAFLAIADNLRLNGCLSGSDPLSRDCVPSWGSQPPGYPVFLAAVRTIGASPRLAIAMQVILFTLAACWLAVSVPYTSRLHVAGRMLPLVASPLTFAWGRWVLTETLAVAATMCAFAVMCRAVHAKRVNVLELGAVLAVAMLIRWDQIWLMLPAVAVVGFLHARREALVRAIVVVCIACLPYLALSVRAVRHGLPPVPTNSVDLDMPPNILRFWRAAALDQRATTGLIWESWSRRYANVQTLNLQAFSSSVPRSELTSLIGQLSRLPQESGIPAELDQDFGRLATGITSEHPVQAWVAVPFMRAVRIWTWHDKQFFSGWEGVGGWMQRGEAWRTAYRILLLFLCGLALLKRSGQPLRRIGFLVCLYVFGRTCFLVSPPMTMLETRYLVETFPAMEFVGLLVLARIITTPGTKGVACSGVSTRRDGPVS